MSRKLVAALACRAGGSRLYGKPLQNLDRDTTILDHILQAVSASPEIDAAVLGISEGWENLPFIDVAKQHGVAYIIGDQRDVLWRLIQCGRAAAATDVFRITTECPFTSWELLATAWQRHVDEDNDITVVDLLPEGMNFEIYSLAALETSHTEGSDAERSEYCSAFARRCPERFRIGLVGVPEEWHRLDLRLTVDYPEDLILCRGVFDALSDRGPRIPTKDILAFVDSRADLRNLVQDYVEPEALWTPVVDRNNAARPVESDEGEQP